MTDLAESSPQKIRGRLGGRAKGTPNKATAEIKALAREHGPDAILFLVAVFKDVGHPIEARINAAREVLSRGYGRPSQAIDVDVAVAINYGTLSEEQLAERAEQVAQHIRNKKAAAQLPEHIEAELMTEDDR